PLSTWLPARSDVPVLGPWLVYDEVAYLFSYAGVAYDLTIPFLLWWSRTRPLAFLAVIIFHGLTALLFPIGLFPWIMIVGSLVFFTDADYTRLLGRFVKSPSSTARSRTVPPWLLVVLAAYFCVQVVLPLRRFAYAENQLWTERHYRFGWNVMLAEKMGAATFTIRDPATQRRWVAYPSADLSRIQEKQMAYQPDMIWQYARHLGRRYGEEHDIALPEVYVDVWVSFNGRPSRRYLPETLDLLTVSRSEVYDWVLPAPP
ncbi:MAG: HTTM domain-containing protein, partial [Bacteroidota bacterium]